MTTKEARKKFSSRRKTTIPTLPSVYPYPDKNASGFKKRYAVEFFRTPKFIHFLGEHHRVLKKD